MQSWNGVRVLIIGAARQGTALARYLALHGAGVVLNDQREAAQLIEEHAALADVAVEWALGGHPLSLLDEVDLVCPSGGVPLEMPLVAGARARGLPLSNDSQIFLEAAPCKVIGITGSAGKTTTTTLVGRMAEAAVGLEGGPQRVWVGGNIGFPLIAHVDEMQPGDLVVMELSSFQLELMARSPQVAAVLNVTPNHLDRHGTMAAYTAAKARILDFQQAADWAVLNRDDAGAWSLAPHLQGNLIPFGVARPPAGPEGGSLREVVASGDEVIFRDQEKEWVVVSQSQILLRGSHNLQNVLASCAIAAAASLPVEAMRAGVAGFHGVAHRLEVVRTWRGVTWVNDSIATAPERAMAAIRSFDGPLVLLAGGRDKNLPWDEFAALVCERVAHLVVFGELAGLIAERVRLAPGTARPLSVVVCKNLREAVQAAAEVASPGEVVLFSPGGTSFDEFRDFAERGEGFKQWVFDLP